MEQHRQLKEYKKHSLTGHLTSNIADNKDYALTHGEAIIAIRKLVEAGMEQIDWEGHIALELRVMGIIDDIFRGYYDYTECK